MSNQLLQPIRDRSSPDPETAIPRTASKSALAQDTRQAMSGEPLQRKVVITNPQGFHMRPISAFVKLAGQFQSAVYVSNQVKKKADGKSVLGLMELAAEQGTELVLEVAGPDQDDALQALLRLMENLSEYDPDTCESNGGGQQ